MKKVFTLALSLLILAGCSAKEISNPPVVTTPEVTVPKVTAPEVTTTISPVLPEGYNPDTYKELFSSPTSEYRWNQIVHATVPNYLNNTTSFANSLRTMVQRGGGGYVFNVQFSKDYIDSQNAFKDLNNASKLIKDSGLEIWLYDELGYPSGAAGGRTAKDNPEYASQGLVYGVRNGSGKEPVTIDNDGKFFYFHSAYAIDESGELHPAEVTNDRVYFEGVSGDWILHVFAVKEFYEGTHAQTNGYGGNNWVSRRYINIMDKNAVRAFINNTYKPYSEKFEYFDQVVGIFTDEPSLMEVYQHTGSKVHEFAQLSWCKGFDEKFEQMHGYSISDKLHLIFTSDSDEAKIVRINYRQTVAEMVAESYFSQIAQFCESHGTALSGHTLLEETIPYHAHYYGDLMKCLRKMTIPGVDSLSGYTNSFMNEDWPIFMAVKYATSATTLEGKERLTMVELCATDFKVFPTPSSEKRQIWNTMNIMFFEGITTINAYLPIDQAASDIKGMTDYFGRLSYMSRHAAWDGDIALYYPINTFQAYSKPSRTATLGAPSSNTISKVARAIYNAQLDFTVADNEFILEAEIKNGTLTNGNVSFKAICMPSIEAMPLEVLQKLINFEKAGGSVIWIDSVPAIPDSIADIPSFRELTEDLRAVDLSVAVSILKNTCGYNLSVSSSNVMIGKYSLDNSTMYWVYNYSDKSNTVTINKNYANGYDVYDPVTGAIDAKPKGSLTVELGAGNAKLIVVKNG